MMTLMLSYLPGINIGLFIMHSQVLNFDISKKRCMGRDMKRTTRCIGYCKSAVACPIYNPSVGFAALNTVSTVYNTIGSNRINPVTCKHNLRQPCLLVLALPPSSEVGEGFSAKEYFTSFHSPSGVEG